MIEQTTKLGEVASWVRGLTYSKKDEVESGGIAVLRATNIDLSSHKIVLDEIRHISDAVKVKDDKYSQVGDLLICTASGSKSHVGKVALIEEDLGMAFGGFMAAIRCNQKCYPRFLYYVLTSKDFKLHLNSLSDGANINNLKFSQIEEYEFRLPPLTEQKRIVAKLDAAFAEIDKAIQLAYLKEIEIEQLGANLLSNFLNDRKYILEDVKLEDVCLKITDGSHFSPKTVENGFPYITVRDINHDGIDFTNCKFISKESYLELSKNGCSPVEGDLLFSKDGTVGKVAEVKTKKDFAVLSSLAILTPNKNLISTELLAYILKSQSFLREAIGQKTGVAIRRIILKNLKKISFKLPSFSKQDSLVSKLDAASVEIELARDSIKRIHSNYHALKSSILKKELQSEAA